MTPTDTLPNNQQLLKHIISCRHAEDDECHLPTDELIKIRVMVIIDQANRALNSKYTCYPYIDGENCNDGLAEARNHKYQFCEYLIKSIEKRLAEEETSINPQYDDLNETTHELINYIQADNF